MTEQILDPISAVMWKHLEKTDPEYVAAINKRLTPEQIIAVISSLDKDTYQAWGLEAVRALPFKKSTPKPTIVAEAPELVRKRKNPLEELREYTERYESESYETHKKMAIDSSPRWIRAYQQFESMPIPNDDPMVFPSFNIIPLGELELLLIRRESIAVKAVFKNNDDEIIAQQLDKAFQAGLEESQKWSKKPWPATNLYYSSIGEESLSKQYQLGFSTGTQERFSKGQPVNINMGASGDPRIPYFNPFNGLMPPFK